MKNILAPFAEVLGTGLVDGLALQLATARPNCLPMLLSEVSRPGVPLVLVAGSYSWPPLRRFAISLLATAAAAAADMALVYIAEVHAEDEWPISSSRDTPKAEPVRIQQHQAVDERAAAAGEFDRDFGCACV